MKQLDLQGWIPPQAQSQLVSIIHEPDTPYHRLILHWPANMSQPRAGQRVSVRVMVYESWERPCAFCGAVLTQDWDALLTNAPAGCEGPECCQQARSDWQERRNQAFDAILQATREASAHCDDPA